MYRLYLTLAVIAVCFGCQHGLRALAVNNPSSRSFQEEDNPLLNPAVATERAPEEFKVRVATTKGEFVIKVNRGWSPNGADRFYNLVKIGYFNDIAVFRAIKGFMCQFGIHGDPAVSAAWREATIKDDPRNPAASNQKGFVTFAKTGRPNSRSVQFFVNLGDNSFLDKDGFQPFGRVVDGMEVVDLINTEYGENKRHVQARFQTEGNAFIREEFPNIDYIQSIILWEE